MLVAFDLGGEELKQPKDLVLAANCITFKRQKGVQRVQYIFIQEGLLLNQDYHNLEVDDVYSLLDVRG